MSDWYGLASLRSDLNKWSDIRKEFFNGAYWGAVVAGGAAVAVGGVAAVGAATGGGAALSLGTAVGGAVGAATGGAAALGLGAAALGLGDTFANGSFANGSFAVAANVKPSQERPVARIFGFASGLVLPIAFAVAFGNSVYKYVENHQIRNAEASAPVPANCSRAAVDKEIKKLEAAGFKITLECK